MTTHLNWIESFAPCRFPRFHDRRRGHLERSDVERCSVRSFCRLVRRGESERVRLSRHNSATTSKPYPIPNTYEEEEKEKEARVKFNEIRSGVLNKISGLDPTRLACRPSRRPPVRVNERRHKKGGLAQNRVGLFEPIKRSHRAN